jgi:hypothetical protein
MKPHPYFIFLQGDPIHEDYNTSNELTKIRAFLSLPEENVQSLTEDGGKKRNRDVIYEDIMQQSRQKRTKHVGRKNY